MDTEEFLRTYETELRGMTRADKGIINSLTMLAADYVGNADLSVGIVRTIEQVVKTVAPQLKLIPLYLMDSIVKNVGGTYTSLFMANLTPTFCDAFAVVDNKTRQSFIKLLDTWQTQNVFSQQKNDEIRLRLANILTQEANAERNAVIPPVIVAPAPAPAPFTGVRMPSAGNVRVPNANDPAIGQGFMPSSNFRPPLSIQEHQNKVNSLLGSLQQSNAMMQQAPMPMPPPMMVPPPVQQPMMMPQGPWPPQAPAQHPPPMHPVVPQQPPMQPGMQPHFPGHPGHPPPQPHHQPPPQQGMFPPRFEPPRFEPPPHVVPQQPNMPPQFHQQFQPPFPTPQHNQARAPDHGLPPAQGMQPARQPIANRTLNASELNSLDVSEVIRALYDDQPFECKSDGRRFRTKEELEKHLDKLFQINKARKDATGIKERQWFRPVEDWVACADIIERSSQPDAGQTESRDLNLPEVKSEAMEVEDPADAARVPADEFDHGVRCAACNEELRRIYDSEEDCWVFKGVVRVNPAGQTDTVGRILVHRKCFQPGNRYSAEVPTTPMASTPRAGGERQWVAVKTESGA